MNIFFIEKIEQKDSKMKDMDFTERRRSLKINMVLNAIKGMLSVIFPLITFPYISKILGVQNVGKYNFSNSVMSYFLLLSALGIKTYAIREGARIRKTKNEIAAFINEIFTINVISTVFAYVVFFIFLIIVPKFRDYRSTMTILSFQIFFTTIGIEWIYSIYEDYLYITIRSIFFNIVSFVLLFTLVKEQNDLNIYAGITVLSSVGSNILNFIHARKYCKVRLIKTTNWCIHRKSILILFAMQIATTIYVSSDTTILGFLWDDRIVGIYAVSAKVYSIIKNILSAIIVVSIPRLSALLGENNEKQFNVVAKDIYITLLTFVIPAIVGIIMLRKQMIMIVSNADYLSATSSLGMLSLALIFCLGAWFWGQAILVPMKKEKFVFKATVISAVINIILNLILIPVWKENAAALTTVVAESVAFVMQWREGRKYVVFSGIGKLLIKIAIGCVGIIGVFFLCNPLKKDLMLYTFTSIGISIFVYGSLQILMKNEMLIKIKQK